jgi:hypothetical protein
MEQLNAELKPGEAELTKQELTRQLAIKWKSLSGSDKKVQTIVIVLPSCVIALVPDLCGHVREIQRKIRCGIIRI